MKLALIMNAEKYTPVITISNLAIDLMKLEVRSNIGCG